MLAWNRYGKARVRLVKVRRDRDPHELVDLTIDVALEGAFEPVYLDGDNTLCVATDTMKNTVYAFARQDPIEHVEAFSARLADHFAATPAVTRATISAAEHRWARLSSGGRPHPHAFTQQGPDRWTTMVSRGADGTRVRSGVADLVVLKTTDSGFSGFPRDAFTTLRETDDRIFATSVTATWLYRPDTQRFGVREDIKAALVGAFAAHESRSVQHTLYAMAQAALEVCADIEEVTLSMPNRHHLLVNLEPFGLDNPNEIFVPTDQPFGLIEATVTR